MLSCWLITFMMVLENELEDPKVYVKNMKITIIAPNVSVIFY